jgi:hypothetical protein
VLDEGLSQQLYFEWAGGHGFLNHLVQRFFGLGGVTASGI